MQARKPNAEQKPGPQRRGSRSGAGRGPEPGGAAQVAGHRLGWGSRCDSRTLLRDRGQGAGRASGELRAPPGLTPHLCWARAAGGSACLSLSFHAAKRVRGESFPRSLGLCPGPAQGSPALPQQGARPGGSLTLQSQQPRSPWMKGSKAAPAHKNRNPAPGWLWPLQGVCRAWAPPDLASAAL